MTSTEPPINDFIDNNVIYSNASEHEVFRNRVYADISIGEMMFASDFKRYFAQDAAIF